MSAAVQRRTRPPQGMAQTVVTVPPPTRGLNTNGDIANMDPMDALEMDNVIANELGVTLRSGWSEYATNINGGQPIRTVMSYDAAPSNAMVPPLTNSVLFATTDAGIYNVEGGGNMAAVAPKIALSGSTYAGHMSCVQFTAAGGAQYLIACSETDGGFIYDGVTWKKMTSVGAPGPGVITGVDPSTFVQVCAWKRRLLFVKRGSGEMWFLPVEAVGGAAQMFDFGPQLSHGGALLALMNWTQDDGAGIDDRLVVLGSSGDISIYSGTDPSSATDFGNAGVWFIGQPPVGRRCFTTSGGNVYILTQYGVVPIAQVVQGGLDNILTSDTDLLKQLRKIQNVLNNDFQTLLNTPGWELINLPNLALLHIAKPGVSVTDNVQYVFQMHNTAWSRLLDVPGVTFYRRLNEVYAGTVDGRVLRVFSGSTDGLKLDGTGSQEIRARVTPAFNYLGAPTVNKQALMIRVNFLAKSSPGWNVLMNVDFELNPIISTPVPGGSSGSLWDVARWDQDYWSGGKVAFGEWRSVTGLGYALAPSIYISSEQATTIASIEYMVKAGGPL